MNLHATSIILTFDLGTTNFKAALFDEGGRVLALARQATPIESADGERREIGVAAFERTLMQLASELRQQDAAALARTAGVCFATQANSFVLLDERDQPLTPIVLWNDRRVRELPAVLTGEAMADRFAAQTGLAGGPGLAAGGGHEFAVAKVLWLRENEPALFARARTIRFIGDQLAWWLTGRHVTEAGAAGLTGLLDIHRLQWRQAALDGLGLSHLQWPTVLRAGADLGPLRPQAARSLGIPGAPVHCRAILGCLDQYAGALGAGLAGATDGRHVAVTAGTVLAAVVLRDRFAPRKSVDDNLCRGPAWRDGLYWHMRFSNVSAGLLEPLRESGEDVADLLAQAAVIAPGAEGLTLDRDATHRAGRAIFRGETHRHTRAHRVAAIVQGVAAAIDAQVRSLCPDAQPAQVRLIGGAARGDVWLRAAATACDVPVVAVDCPEPTSLGAAALALAGLQHQPLEAIVQRVVRVRS